MYTPKEDQTDDIVNPYWNIYIKEVIDIVMYINNNMSKNIDNRRLNWKIAGSKEYPNVTICIQSTEMLMPVHKIKNPDGKTPLVRKSYSCSEDLITQIIDTYNNHTKFELNGEK